MAVGETAGQERAGWSPPAVPPVAPALPPRPRRRGRRRAADRRRPTKRSSPLIREADPEFERLLAEEEEIERSTREHHETPHFRPGDGD